MTIRTEQFRVAVTGTAGSATGSRTTGVVNGRILAVHLGYTGQPATTDVSVATTYAPTRNILTISNANTDAWFYPRVVMTNTSGAAITFDGTQPIFGEIPVNDEIVVTVSQGDPGNIVATILYEQ